MKKILFFASLILGLSYWHNPVNAQDNGNKKKSFAERFKEQMQINKEKLANGNKSKSPSSTGETSITFRGNHFLDGGNVAENVKYIDADRWAAFNQGFAIVGKSSAAALINAEGEFVYPYSAQYGFFTGMDNNVAELYALSQSYRHEKYNYYTNGIFEFLRSPQHQYGGFIKDGKLLVTKNSSPFFQLSANKRYLQITSNSTKTINGTNYTVTQTTVIMPDGTKSVFPYSVTNINEGIGIATTPPSGKMAFISVSGKLLTDFIYEEAYEFSDDMAIVGSRDAYGQMKYGAINRQGQVVVPLTYSVKPGNFSGGFARVQPKDKTQAGFEYGYIDKNGELLATLKETVNQFGTFAPYGLAFSGIGVLTKDFKMMTRAEFFRSFGLPEDCHFTSHSSGQGSWVEGETNNKIFYSHNKIKDTHTKNGGSLIGFINLATGKVIKPSFSKIGQFDPVSKLAYAETVIGATKYNQPIYRKGYINEDGTFVLLEAEKSTW